MGEIWVWDFYWRSIRSEFLGKFIKVGKIDILIDDGGHTNEQQINTLLSSYENINEDGTIIIEDTHTSYLKEFGNPSKYSFMNFCNKIIDDQNKKSLKDQALKNI